jgi:hypothetical protein
LFRDDFGIIVDPENLDYRYFLNYESKTELLSLARLAGLYNKQTNFTKEDLANFLSIEIPRVLPIVVNELNSNDRLICEIVVSAGGCMPVWEVNARIKIESRLLKKSSNLLNEQLPQQNGWNDEKNSKLQDIDEDEDEDEDNLFLLPSYSHGVSKSLLPLFGFTKHLYSNNRGNKKESKKSQSYFIIPKEAREYFKTRSLKVDVIPLNCDKNEDMPSAIQAPQLMQIMQALFDDISLKHPKPTPKLGLVPKSIFLPIFKQFVAKSQALKKLTMQITLIGMILMRCSWPLHMTKD